MEIYYYTIAFIGVVLSICIYISWKVAEERDDDYVDKPFYVVCVVVIWLACGLVAWGIQNGSKQKQKRIEQNKLHIASNQEITFYLKGSNDFFKIDSISVDTSIVFSEGKFYRIEDLVLLEVK